MDCGFGRSSEKNVIGLLSVFVVVALSFCAAAEAYIYDDFSSAGIDIAKWTISDPLHLFSQPGDGQLYFNSDNTAASIPRARWDPCIDHVLYSRLLQHGL